jgi:hypothetical protein
MSNQNLNADHPTKGSAMTEMPRLKITAADIERIKRRHILENLSYSVVDAAQLLAVSVSKVYRLVDSGELVNGNDTPGRRGTVITALSIESYSRKRIARAASE